jgi:hypothetical protein
LDPIRPTKFRYWLIANVAADIPARFALNGNRIREMAFLLVPVQDDADGRFGG